MPQIFHRSTNTIARVSIAAVVGFVVVGAAVGGSLFESTYLTRVQAPQEQPVPFSHEHHVGGLGIDCRYCHTTVERSAFAGMPATEVCMNCHKQIWSESEMLEPVRASYRTNVPLRWNRVYEIAQFAYFDHSIHVHEGIGCVSCHGRVDHMPLLWRTSSLFMKWCIGCHAEPWRNVRPREHVFDLDWTPDEPQETLGPRLVAEYGIKSPKQLMSCDTCHR